MEAGTRRTAYYTKVPHVSYRFRVIACNNDGVWNEEGAALGIVISPRFHETTWFRGLLALSIVLSGLLLHRFRVARLNRQKAELERLVAARTAEVEERTAELEVATTRLAQLAREDGLTGVANRRAFDAALDDEWRRAHRLQTALSLIPLDIDSFKAYNDRHGHQAGDTALRAVSQAAATRNRRAGELVARYGGEELAILLPGVPRDEAAGVAESLRLRVLELALPHPDSSVAPCVTVSAGVASTEPGAAGSPADLGAAADRALYIAKQRGRNRVEVDLHAAPNAEPGALRSG